MFGSVMYLPGTVLVLFASTVTSLLPGSQRLETTSAAPAMFSCCVQMISVMRQPIPAPAAASRPFRDSSVTIHTGRRSGAEGHVLSVTLE